MALTYNTFTTSLANLLVVPVSDPGYVEALPNIIDDLEQRLYRELDLLNTTTRNSASALVSGNRNFTVPGDFITVDEINVITPAGTTDPDLGTRNPLLPSTKEMLDMLYPSSAGAAVPQYFGMITQSSIVVGPWPDAAYQVEVVGTTRPEPLSASNQTTILTTLLPDLVIAAGMVFACGYQQNFSAQGDNPQSAVSWESHLQLLLKSATVEEARKKFTAEGWSSEQPAPLATPPRT